MAARLTPRASSVEAYGGWMGARGKVYATPETSTAPGGGGTSGGGAVGKGPAVRRGGGAYDRARDDGLRDLVPTKVLPPPPDSWDADEFAAAQSISLGFTLLNEPLGFRQLSKFLLRTGPVAENERGTSKRTSDAV